MKAKRRRVWPFTMYTPEQWEAIERALQPAEKGPLTKNEMGLLYYASSLYKVGQHF
jgi:hypothetical protein